MEQSFVLVLVGLTSSAACLIGTRVLGMPARGLGRAVARMFESLGIIAVFFALNVVGGGLAILALRTLGRSFVSLYMANDLTVLALSAIQGLVFQAWRAEPRRQRPTA